MSLYIEVIEWRQDDGTEIVHRFEPGGEIKWGAQLTVTENQWAVFFRDGKALDTFGPGRYTLETKNIPLLVEALKIPFGGKSPFRADVYFVARKTFPDLRWGTKDPVVFRDPEFDMVRLRAHGKYAIRVADPRKMVNTLVGTMGRYTTEDIQEYLRGIIVARLNDVLGEAKIPLLDMPSQYDELALMLRGRVEEDFAGLGLAVDNLVIGAITPPEEVAQVIDERAGMAAAGMRGSYVGFKAARAMGDAAKGGAGGGGAATEGMGLGVGAGLGMAIPGMMREALGGGGGGGAAGTATAPGGPSGSGGPATETGLYCASCGARVPPDSRFCPQCGKPLAATKCAKCGAVPPPGAKFCPQCGNPL